MFADIGQQGGAVPFYDLTAIRLDIARAQQVLARDITALERAFIWARTPQGADYWRSQSGGHDDDARSTIAFMIAQSIEFEILQGRAAA